MAFEVEHIEPGGPDAESNLALACRSCNLYKSDRTSGIDLATGETVRLFNPRLARWEDHFAIDPDEFIRGISAMGSITIEQLKMNSPQQIQAGYGGGCWDYSRDHARF